MKKFCDIQSRNELADYLGISHKSYFFGISLDGADAMKFLYRYHVGKGRVSEYLKYFRQLSGCNSIILLFFYTITHRNAKSH